MAKTRTCDESIRTRLLFPPGWYEHGDVPVASPKEPVHRQLDALAGKHFFVPMTVGK